MIDQDRLMVVSENAGDIIYTKDFNYFIDEQELGLYVCRRADPETKGKVENLVKFVKGNFLATRDFEIVEEANDGVLRRQRGVRGSPRSSSFPPPRGAIEFLKCEEKNG